MFRTHQCIFSAGTYPSENFDATKYKLVLSRYKPSVSFLVTKFSGKALQLSFWTKRLTKLVFYISPKKNYPCQLIKTRTWIYCNILWKKRWKINFSGPISKKKIGCYNTSGFLSHNQYFEILCTFSHSMGDTGCLK